MTIYYALGRVVRPFLLVGFFGYNIVFHQPRARVIISNEFGELLLVKDWSGSTKWSFPGGGIHRHEIPAAAAVREVYEETGVAIPQDRLRFIVTIKARQYEAPIFRATVRKSLLPRRPHNPREITHIGWFLVKNLPELSKTSAQAIAYLKETNQL